MKSVALLAFVLFGGYSAATAQLKSYQFDQWDSLQYQEERLTAIYIYTDWCKYCAAMKNTTLRNSEVVEVFNNKYYFFDLNAEENRAIKLRGHTFGYKPSGRNTGIHELAEQLGKIDGQVSYPTLCILNPGYEIIFQYNQFMKASDLVEVLTELTGNQ